MKQEKTQGGGKCLVWRAKNVEDKTSTRRSSFSRPHDPPADELGHFVAMTTTLASELERLAKALESETLATTEIPVSAMAEKIAKSLGLKADEVAILGVSTRWRHLHFLVPQALKNVGFVPLSSTSALAARTVRDNRPEINNNFSAVRHATVFEGVKAPTVTGETIHKIISAPIVCDEKVVGVMQISRKGPTAAEAGPDFTSDDLREVTALCRPLGKLVRHLAGE